MDEAVPYRCPDGTMSQPVWQGSPGHWVGECAQGGGATADAAFDGDSAMQGLWQTASCIDSGWDLARQNVPASAVDYLSVRRSISTSEMGTTFITSEVVSEVGVVCGGAGQLDGCLADVEEQVAAQGGGQYFLITTGDRVATYRSEADKLLFLGHIDTPDEALFGVGLTLHNGYYYEAGCSGGEARQVPEGYEVRATVFVEHCSDAGMEQHLLSVDSEGTVTVVDVEKILPTECPVQP